MRAFRTTTLLSVSLLALAAAAPTAVVITAQKRAQDPVGASMAVTVCSGKFLAAVLVDDGRKYDDSVPL